MLRLNNSEFIAKIGISLNLSSGTNYIVGDDFVCKCCFWEDSYLSNEGYFYFRDKDGLKYYEEVENAYSCLYTIFYKGNYEKFYKKIEENIQFYRK